MPLPCFPKSSQGWPWSQQRPSKFPPDPPAEVTAGSASPSYGPWVLLISAPTLGASPHPRTPIPPPLPPTPAVPPETAPDDSQEQEQEQEGPADIHSHCRGQGGHTGVTLNLGGPGQPGDPV